MDIIFELSAEITGPVLPHSAHCVHLVSHALTSSTEAGGFMYTNNHVSLTNLFSL